jgi:hypothetical protein
VALAFVSPREPVDRGAVHISIDIACIYKSQREENKQIIRTVERKSFLF